MSCEAQLAVIKKTNNKDFFLYLEFADKTKQ